MKKINKYLLENHPILWNLRLPHLLAILVPSIIILFVFGYIIKDLDHSIYAAVPSFFLFSVTFLSSLVLFIFWIVQYNQNSTVNNFYPRSVTSIYFEWIGILVICILFVSVPLAQIFGGELKSDLAQNKDSSKEIKTIVMGNVFLANDSSRYMYTENITPLKIDTKTNIYVIPAENLRSNNGDIEYIGPSFIYYDTYYSNYYDFDEQLVFEAQKTAIEALKNKDVKTIRKIMDDYLALCKKNKVETNLNTNKWFDMIYNPPLYPVLADNIVDRYNYLDYYYDDESHAEYFVDKSSLEANYSNHYRSEADLEILLNVIFYVGLFFSLCIFSARFSKGINILFAFIWIVVALFIFSILSALSSSLTTMFVLWSILCVVVWVILFCKINNKLPKQHSEIYIHLAIWFIPLLVPFIGFFVDLLSYDGLESISTLNIINIIFIILIMYPLSKFCLSWKALPED